MARSSPKSARSTVSLAELRQRLGRSQAQVATAIGTTNQSGVSRIERQPDIHVSTLADYVEALGGQLRLVVEHDDGPFEITVASLGERQEDPPSREYRVVWQDRHSRALVHVGWLQFTGREFVFSYTEDARRNASFVPFAAFPTLDGDYRSNELFPFFAVRLVSTADPGFDALIDALGLSRSDATPAELLALGPVDSPHDTIQVVPEPSEEADGSFVRSFLVSGVRHAVDLAPDKLARLLGEISEGTELQLVPEPDNPRNVRAIRLALNGTAVGWIPDYLLDEVHGYLDSGRAVMVSVARANRDETPWHLRLLCQMIASPPAA